MSVERPPIDIQPEHWAIVRDILKKHVPNLNTSANLREDFSDSDLPWKVDVVDWATTSASFRALIERTKVRVKVSAACGG